MLSTCTRLLVPLSAAFRLIDISIVMSSTLPNSFSTSIQTSPSALVSRERHVLSQIVRGVPLRDVLEDLLYAVETHSADEMLTSVLLLSDDAGHLIHGAAPSLPDAYNEAIDGIVIGEGQGSCGTVAVRRTPVYATDIATDPLWRDFRDLALTHQLTA